MRVERLRIGAFGGLRGLDTGEAPLPGLVAVHGPNEAGKTTFFHFLTTVLYGFQPATRDAHPYAPWEGGDAEGEAVLRMAGGEAWTVRRRLRSTPRGSLAREGVEEDLRNRPLPCVGHVPRAVFRQVFALTLAELAGLEGEGWSAVQDRLLVSMAAGDLRPARSVAAELEREAGELWRPNRRGRQHVRELRERALDLRKRRRAALEADARLRDASATLAHAAKELQALRRERAECRAYLERQRSLLPLRDQLRRLRALEAEAGDPGELDGLPRDPAERQAELDRLLDEAGERLAGVIQETREPRSRIEAYGAAEERLVRKTEEVRELLARALPLESEGVRRSQLAQELRDLDRRIRATAAEALGEPWSDARRDALRGLHLAGARDAVRAYRSARDERRLAAAALLEAEREAPVRTVGSTWAGWGLILLGAVALVAGVGTGSLVAATVSAPLLAVGVALVGRQSALRRAARRREEAAGRVEQARRAEEGARRGVIERLAPLEPGEEVAAEPDEGLVAALERVQDLLRDHDDRAHALQALEARARAVGDAVRALARELGLEVTGEATASAHLLAARLREAEVRGESAAAARRELERLSRERRRLERESDRLRGERDRLRARLEAIGDGDAARGLERARARLEASGLARRLRSEMAAAHPDLDALSRGIAEAEGAGEDWPTDQGALATRYAREEELTDRIEALARRADGLAREVERLSAQETADAVDGELLLLEEELSEARRKRDRLWILARLLREAERRFREEHQPDVIRRAGAHLNAITAGRYGRILVGEGGREGTFQLDGAAYAAPVPLGEPVSTGTREQVYLALRLAVVDHLDRGGERMPLFMDEAFVNWDPDRLGRGLEVLARIAERRQVFLFSCHPEIVERVRRHGARVVRLGGWAG